MVAMRFWLGDLLFEVAILACGGDNTGEVHSPNS
jgi:hypothetical protein